MRRKRRLRLRDLPRLLVSIVVGVAGLFGSRYRRLEGAHILATDDQGRILCVRTTYLGQGWMLPGGRVEHGETPHGGAVRETLEETGLETRAERLLLIDASDASGVTFIFAGQVTGGTLEPQLGEIAEAGWIGRDEIAASSPRLAYLLEQIDRAGEHPRYLGLSEGRR